MKKHFSISILALTLASCGKSPQTFHYEYIRNSNHPYSQNMTPEQYDEWINSWSEDGHLYFHYNRGENATAEDYNKYCLWVWQFEPDSLEGSLWGFKSNTKVSETLTLQPMSRAFMCCEDIGVEGGSETYRDKYGIVFDVDLYNESLIGGKTGEPTTFVGADAIGFLLPLENSMSGVTNWDSDGGAETYLEDFSVESNWRKLSNDGKAIHVFVSTGALTDYRYNVSGGMPEPEINPIDNEGSNKYDSKSNGVDKDKTFDIAATSDKFKSLGVGYQIFVSSFRDSNGDGKGDIRGIIEALPYLENLGVQCLWLTPVQKSGSYHGYDATDYTQIDKRYGTLEDYKELINECHKRGMSVLMDLVLNHTSKSNTWFQKSKWGYNDPSLPEKHDDTGIKWRDVYNWKYKDDTIQKAVLKNEGGKFVVDYYKNVTVKEDAESSNPSWYKIGESNYYYYGKFGSGMPELNYDSDDTRKLVINVARDWLALGVDGFRLDAVKHIYMFDETSSHSDKIAVDVGEKTSYDDEKGKYITKQFDYSTDIAKNVQWWRQFAKELKSPTDGSTGYPNCFLVGENFDGWGTRISPYYQGLDSQFDFSNFYHTPAWIYNHDGGAKRYETVEGQWGGQIHETFESFETSNDVTFGDITMQGGSRPDFINGAFTSNHDVMRLINSASGVGDQNDTKPNDNVKYGDEWANGRAKFMGALAMLNPGLSWLYYGDELGMTSNTNMHRIKYGNENSSDIWYRQPFLWNDSTARTSYRAGQYKFELDDHNKHLLNNGEGIKYNKETGTFETLNTMLPFFSAVCHVKQAYPKNAKIDYHWSSFNVLRITVTGEGSKTIEVFINNGRSNDEYKMTLEGGYTSLGYYGDESLAINGADIGAVRFGFAAFVKGA